MTTLKTITILLFTVSLFSCSAHAGPREHRYKSHHDGYYIEHQRHHHKHKNKHIRKHKRKHKSRRHRHRHHDCGHYVHYRGSAHSPAYVIPGLELSMRYGFPAGEAAILYRSPYGY